MKDQIEHQPPVKYRIECKVQSVWYKLDVYTNSLQAAEILKRCIQKNPDIPHRLVEIVTHEEVIG